MKEYIERMAIIPALKDYYEPINPDFPTTLKLSQISEVLQNMPVTDVAPVRHGRWNDGICFECGFDAMYYKGESVQVYTRYCPACGALIDGKEVAHD